MAGRGRSWGGGAAAGLGSYASMASLNADPGAIAALASGKPAEAFVTGIGYFKAFGGAWVPARNSSLTWRGIGQGMSFTVQGFGGGTNVWSQTYRSRHYSNVRFKRVRAVIPTFYTTGPSLADTPYPDDYNFQLGFEQAFLPSLTGLQPRRMFTFGGSTVAQYLAASPPASGFILSDVMELDSYVEVGPSNFFGLWTTVEAAARAGSNKIPYTRNGSNFLQKYLGVVGSANVSQIDADTARSATSVTAVTNSQGGASSYFTPCMLLIETDSGLPFIVGIGDSITYGVGESVAGSGSYGDGTGSALSNLGYLERGVHEVCGFSLVNLGRGSDGNKFLSTPANWQYRKQLLTLANPTHVVNAHIHNDPGSSAVALNWAANTAYNKWDPVFRPPNHYVCVKPGTSGATGPSGTSGGIVDGTAIFAYVQPRPGNAVGDASICTFAQMANVNEQIATAIPGVKIIGMAGTPDAASTDAWATAANQTPAQGWVPGPTTDRRTPVNTQILAKNPILKLSAVIQPNSLVEDSYPAVTGKWVSNGTPSLVTNDGTHPNSYGHYLMSLTVTPDKFA